MRVKIDVGLVEVSASLTEIGIYWDLSHDEHKRSWLVAAVGGNANMQMTTTPFDKLNPKLQARLEEAYRDGRDLDFLGGA